MDYYFVAQGKTSIPGVDDGEELTLTDVRFLMPVFTLKSISSFANKQTLMINYLVVEVFGLPPLSNPLTPARKTYWLENQINFPQTFKGSPAFSSCTKPLPLASKTYWIEHQIMFLRTLEGLPAFSSYYPYPLWNRVFAYLRSSFGLPPHSSCPNPTNPQPPASETYWVEHQIMFSHTVEGFCI